MSGLFLLFSYPTVLQATSECEPAFSLTGEMSVTFPFYVILQPYITVLHFADFSCFTLQSPHVCLSHTDFPEGWSSLVLWLCDTPSVLAVSVTDIDWLGLRFLGLSHFLWNGMVVLWLYLYFDLIIWRRHHIGFRLAWNKTLRRVKDVVGKELWTLWPLCDHFQILNKQAHGPVP